MPLSKQLFPLQFGQGIDTKTDSKLVVPGKLLELENGVFTKLGSIRKRNGFTRLSSNIVGGDAVARADGLAVFRDELLMFGDAGRVYSRSEAMDGWVDRGAIVSVDLTTDPVLRNTYQQTIPASATASGLTLTVWSDSRGGVRYSVRDDATGTLFVDDSEVSSTAAGAGVAVWQGEFVIIYVLANNLFYRRVATTSPASIGVEVNPISTLDPANLRLTVIAGSSNLFVFANDASGVLGRWLIDSSWAVSSRTTVSIPCQAGISAWLGTNGTDVYLVNGVTSSVELAVLSASGSVLAGPTSIGTPALADRITGVAMDTDEGVIFYDDAGSFYATRYHVSGTTLGGDTPTRLALGLKACAACFKHNGAAYCPTTWDSTLQSTCFVLSEDGDVIAKTTPGLSGGHRANIAPTNETSSGVFQFAHETITRVETDAGTFFGRTGVELVTLDFTNSYRYASAELGNNLLISGGMLHAYDGRTICEAGFHLFPEGLTGSAAGSGGSIDAGAHQYRCVYEWTDAQGQIHRSAPSAAWSVTTAANDRVTLTVPTLRVTSKSGVRIGIYRTTAGGSTFYRISSLTSPTLNDTTATSVSYVDSASDASIETNDIIYTDGTANQELENIAPGACSLITTHRGRAFIKTGKNRVSYSKITYDGEPPAFNDGLYLLPDGRGGDVTVIAGMDDKVVIFKERAIFVVGGDGPNNAGQGGYAEPVLVTSDVGCDEPRSVVLTNAGLMFHSPKGIYLLDRSLSVTYVGAPVELFNDLTITSAQLVPSNNQVRFTTSGTVTRPNGETQTNLVLVYDYLMNQWSTFTNISAVDSAVWQGQYVWATSAGRTYVEAPDTYTDDGEFIQLRFVTAWISLAQLNGFQRIYRLLFLGDYKSDHDLRVRLGYDFTPEYTFDQTVTVSGPGTWGSDATWGSGTVWGGAWPSEWWRISPARQKCSSIRICVEDVEGDTPGEGIAVTGIGILAGVKNGTNKMAASRSI